MRYSKQREAVYQVVCSTKCHPDAYWVYGEVRKVIPNISLGTVYRNLAELCQQKKLIKVCGQGNVERYDGYVEPHAHFVCESCGNVLDVDTQKVDFCHTLPSVTHTEITLYGTCDNCLKAKD